MQESNPTAAAGGPDSAAPPADSVLLEAEVIELRSQLEACRQESLRVLADVENQRKRMARDAEQARRYATERLISTCCRSRMRSRPACVPAATTPRGCARASN